MLAVIAVERASRVLDALYPPAAYDSRRLAARDAALATSTSGSGGVPLAGSDLVYGEFELPFFHELVGGRQRARRSSMSAPASVA